MVGTYDHTFSISVGLGARHGPDHSSRPGNGARGTLSPAPGIGAGTEGRGRGDPLTYARLFPPELPVPPRSARAGIFIGDERRGYRLAVRAG
eukprot:1932036-Pleurochrysis_carterae.AAC.1